MPPEACTITEPPPEIQDPKLEDFGKPGDPGCGANYEACLSRRAARHYLDLLHYAQENYAKCRSKTKSPIQ